MDQRDSHCPYSLSSEITAKLTVLGILVCNCVTRSSLSTRNNKLIVLLCCATAGQEDPFELDSNLLLSSGRHGEDRKRQYFCTTMKHRYLAIWLTNCTWHCHVCFSFWHLSYFPGLWQRVVFFSLRTCLHVFLRKRMQARMHVNRNGKQLVVVIAEIASLYKHVHACKGFVRACTHARRDICHLLTFSKVRAFFLAAFCYGRLWFFLALFACSRCILVCLGSSGSMCNMAAVLAC